MIKESRNNRLTHVSSYCSWLQNTAESRQECAWAMVRKHNGIRCDTAIDNFFLRDGDNGTMGAVLGCALRQPLHRLTGKCVAEHNGIELDTFDQSECFFGCFRG